MAEESSRRENAEMMSDKTKESLSRKEDEYRQSVLTVCCLNSSWDLWDWPLTWLT